MHKSQHWGEPDSARVSVNQPGEIRYWSARLRVDEWALIDAVKHAGPSLSAVSRHLELRETPLNATARNRSTLERV